MLSGGSSNNHYYQENNGVEHFIETAIFFELGDFSFLYSFEKEDEEGSGEESGYNFDFVYRKKDNKKEAFCSIFSKELNEEEKRKSLEIAIDFIEFLKEKSNQKIKILSVPFLKDTVEENQEKLKKYLKK